MKKHRSERGRKRQDKGSYTRARDTDMNKIEIEGE